MKLNWILGTLLFIFINTSAKALEIKCKNLNGQKCSTPIKFDFNIAKNSKYEVKLTAPINHCSTIKYKVSFRGRTIETSDASGAGESAFFSLGLLNKGNHSIKIFATGMRGGCNKGYLSSWGVTPSIYVVKSLLDNKSIATNNSGHSHAGRTHNHPLPKQGVKHRHGKGAYGVSTSGNIVASNKLKSENKVISSSNKLKVRSHLMHRGPRFIDPSDFPLIRDQNNCIHWESNKVRAIHWTGRCSNGFAIGGGALTIYYKDKNTPRKRRSVSLRTEAALNSKAGFMDDAKEQRVKQVEKQKEDKIQKQKKLVVDKDLIKFARKYNFNSLIKGSTDVNAGWSSDEKSLAGVNGSGKISLYLNRSHEATAYITGKFKNGRLIGSAKLKVYASKCYKKGWIFCKVSEDDTTTRSITSSSNIKKYVNTAIDNMLPGMYSRASRTISRLSNSSSSYSSSSQKYGCKYWCEGSFGVRKGPKFQANTPETTDANARKYIKNNYGGVCKNIPGAYGLGYPKCETWYYK